MDLRERYAIQTCERCQTPYLLSRAVSYFQNALCGACVAGKPLAYCIGVGSQTFDGLHVLMMDFDEVKTDIRLSLHRVQMKYSLSSIHVFESSPGSLWAVCFDKLRIGALLGILGDVKESDSDYADIPKFRDHFTLRFSRKGKPVVRYLYTLERSVRHRRMQSSAHHTHYANFFPEILGYPLKHPDDGTYLFVDGYRSRHIGVQHELQVK